MFKDLCLKARSIRRFDESTPITDTELRELVDIARITSCGGNQQPLRYRIVSGPSACSAIFPFIAWAGALKDWGGPVEGERPTGYIAIVSKGEHNTDVGIAAQTLHLAAAEKGYGCCMLGAIRRSRIAAELEIPADHTIDLLLSFVTPGESVVLEDVDAAIDLKYYRTEDGLHHVPKLKLDDVII